MINVAIMGHGTVGSGVAELLINGQKRISDKIGEDICVKYILDLRKFDNLPYSEKFIEDFNIIANDSDVKIAVETMGGINPAYDFVKTCLLNGKSVVTSNKELVAKKGAELIKIAKEKNANFLFEASVGGGIPIIRPLCSCLLANEITEIKGILNGTTNYILNKMIVDNMDFDTALKLAQDKGYAEKNPDADIKGIDSCRKICILASLAFGKHIYEENVKTEGITEITLNDIESAESFGYSIKLIGSAKKSDDGNVSAYVRPTLVSKSHILADVNGVNNAISVCGDAVGEVVFYGKGAGKMPTASAVVADVIDSAKHLNGCKYSFWEDSESPFIKTPDEETVLYVNAKAKDYDSLLSSIISVFGEDIRMIKSSENGEITFLTGKENEKKLFDKINSLDAESIKVLYTLD